MPLKADEQGPDLLWLPKFSKRVLYGVVVLELEQRRQLVGVQLVNALLYVLRQDEVNEALLPVGDAVGRGGATGAVGILTSHAEEFLHRIQQELGVQRAAAIKRYKFLPHQGEHELRVDGDPPTKNYVLLAQQALAADEKREALRRARPALESLTDRLWTWLGRRGDGRIDIKLGGPRSPWELNNKCSKLRSAVDRIAAQHVGVAQAVAALTALFNVNGASIEWGYLNSGVHDSRRDHEFDRATVRVVVESVTALDAALDVLQRR